MPRLVTSEFSDVAAQKGQLISVPLTPALAASDVTPANTPPATQDMTPTAVDVTMANWKEVPFYLTDKDKYDIQEGNMPKVISKAVATLVDSIDTSILTACSEGAARSVGTAGTDPFATTALALAPFKILNDNKASKADRHCVFNPAAEVNLLALDSFANSQFTGDYAAMVGGSFDGNQRLGAKWWMDQNVPTHTKGTGSSIVTNGVLAAGVTTITADGGSGTILAGDVVTFAGDTTQYVVASALSGGSFTIGTPGLVNGVADGVAITVTANHAANVAFVSDAVAFASRPMPASDASVNSDTLSDPISGLSLRLEVTREYKRDRWSVDALWGAKVVQPDAVVKILG